MSLNKMIDHTLLAANATREQIARLCDEAVEHGFASVCVNSCWVGECASRLAETDVNVCTVIGFPLAVVAAAQGRCVKVIIETCLLSDEQIARACEIAVEAGASFVKTSTGFSTGGATVEDVALMARTVAGRCKVKASGGIHTAAEAEAMVAAGASRIGTSSGLAIIGA